MVRYSEELIEEIRSSNDIVDVISKYITLKRSGRNFFGLCPFHKEKSPSFAVSPDKQIFHCFGCGAGGNVIHFISKIEGLDFKDTLELLANRVNIELPTLDNLEDDKTARLKSKVYEINKIAAEFYHENLYKPASKTAQEYIKKRKLDNRTLKAFLIGYAGNFNELYLLLKQKGYTEEEMLASSLVKRTENGGYMDSFRKRLMFPIQDVRERVIAFGGRVLDDSKPKYINSPENIVYSKGRNLFGLNVAKKHDTRKIIIVEGYMDAISLYQRGITNVVASLGTALTAGHAALIKRYVNEVYLTYDSDEAGTKAALRAAPILREAGVTTRVIRMEPYKDPDEFIKNLGAEAFEERIRKARNSFMFGLEMLEKGYDLNAPEGKTEFLREAARRLARFEEEIERDNYIEAVAKTYHVGYEELKKLVVKVAVQSGMAAPATKPRQTIRQETPKEDGHIRSQKILLTWLIDREELFDQVSRYVTPEDFTVELYRKVAELLYEQHAKGELNPAQIMNYFTEEEEHRAVAALFNTRIKELTTAGEQEKAIKETILRVKEYSIETATRNLDPTDIQGLQRLMNAKKAVQDLHKLHISIN